MDMLRLFSIQSYNQARWKNYSSWGFEVLATLLDGTGGCDTGKPLNMK